MNHVCLSFHVIFLHTRHIVYAPAKTNQYAASVFPTISDAIASGDSIELERQVAIATFFIQGASSTLKEFNKFIVA